MIGHGGRLRAPRARSAAADALPYDELTERPIRVGVTLIGTADFPSHVFYLYPSRCVTDDDELPPREGDDPPPLDLRVVRDGPLRAWYAGDNYCVDSALYAIDAAVAASLRLRARTPADRWDLLTRDPRIARATLPLPEAVQAAPRASSLRRVDERLRVVAIHDQRLEILVDSIAYTFRDKTEQVIQIGHAQRPPLPERPFSPSELLEHAVAYAERQAGLGDPPPPPSITPPARARGDDTDADLDADDADDADRSATDTAPPLPPAHADPAPDPPPRADRPKVAPPTDPSTLTLAQAPSPPIPAPPAPKSPADPPASAAPLGLLALALALAALALHRRGR